MEVSDLPDRKFEIMGIKMLTNVRKSMYEHCENSTKNILKAKRDSYKQQEKNSLLQKKEIPVRLLVDFQQKFWRQEGSEMIY